MKRFFSIVLLGTFLAIFSGCGNTDETIDEEKAQENLKSVSFEIQTPEDWEIIPKDQYPKNVVLLKREPSFSNEVSTLLSVSLEQGVYYSLQKFSERNLENIRQNSQDFQLHTREEVTLDSGEKALLVEYSDWYSRGKKRINFYDLYVLNSQQNKSYTVSLIFDPRTSEDHKEFLKKVLKTFVFPSNSTEE